MRVTSFIDTASDGHPGGVPGPDPSGVARCGPIPAGMHTGAARPQLNPRPLEKIAARHPRAVDADIHRPDFGVANAREESRRTCLRTKTTVPSACVSRIGDPRAV